MSNVIALRAPQAPPATDPEFDEFWQAYPRHEAMKEAKSAYRRARKLVTHETLMAGARQHAAQYDPEYATLAHKWLAGERWNDEPVKKPANWRPAAVGSEASDELIWDNRVKYYPKDKIWMPFWGDPPEHPNCHAPLEILVRYGFR